LLGWLFIVFFKSKKMEVQVTKTMKTTYVKAIIFAVATTLLAGCTPQFLKPSNMVSLANVANPGQIQDLRGGNPDGTGAGVFTVPAGNVFVITRVIIHPFNPGAGTLDVTFMQSDDVLGDRIRQTWRVPNSQPTEFDFSPGYVISSGSKLKIRNHINSPGDVAVTLYGYTTPDE
jgi:hypothetical protein